MKVDDMKEEIIDIGVEKRAGTMKVIAFLKDLV